MRGNGLSAESYREIAEVDPATATVLLELFRRHEIAAYCSGAGETRGRLYVDASRTEQATELLDRELRQGQLDAEAELAESEQARATDQTGADQTEHRNDPHGIAELDEEAAWSQIVAAYDQEPGDPVPRWPASEDTSEDEESSVDEDENPTGTRGGTATRSDPGDDLPPLTTTDETERFVPPAPPPLPRLDPVTKAAWLAVLGAPIVFVLTVAFGVTLPTWLTGAISAAFIGGLIALFMKLKSGPPDDTDDGAVV